MSLGSNIFVPNFFHILEFPPTMLDMAQTPNDKAQTPNDKGG